MAIGAANALSKGTHQALFVNVDDKYVFVQVKLGEYQKLRHGLKLMPDGLEYRFHQGDDIKLSFTISTGTNAKNELQSTGTFVAPKLFETSGRFQPHVTLCNFASRRYSLARGSHIWSSNLEQAYRREDQSHYAHRHTRHRAPNYNIRNAGGQAAAQIYHALILDQLPNKAPRKNILVSAGMTDRREDTEGERASRDRRNDWFSWHRKMIDHASQLLLLQSAKTQAS
jgi:hypothetical protein